MTRREGRGRLRVRRGLGLLMAVAALAACEDEYPPGESPRERARAAALHGDAVRFTKTAAMQMAEGDFEQAEITATRAVQADPEYAPAQHALAWAAMHTGNTQVHLIAALEAVRLAPDSAAFRRTLGIAYETNGRLADAERSFLEAVRRAPADTLAWLDLARLAHRRGNYELADSAYGVVGQLVPTHFDTAAADAQRWAEARR